MDEERTCWLCGLPGTWYDPLDRHHCFGGPFRKKADKLGLTVHLHHNECHIFGPLAAHNNMGTMRAIQRYGQRKAMREQGWDTQRFIKEFGKNYLTSGE